MNKPQIDFLLEYDNPLILEELRHIAAAMGSGTVTQSDLKKLGKASNATVVRAER
jgi:hypothetical protein